MAKFSLIFLFFMSCSPPQTCGLASSNGIIPNQYKIVITKGEKSKDTNSKTIIYNFSQGNVVSFTSKMNGKFAQKPFTKDKNIEKEKYNEIISFIDDSGFIEHKEINKAEEVAPIHYIKIEITTTIHGRVQQVFKYYNTQKDFYELEEDYEKKLKKLMDKLEINTGFLMNVY